MISELVLEICLYLPIAQAHLHCRKYTDISFETFLVYYIGAQKRYEDSARMVTVPINWLRMDLVEALLLSSGVYHCLLRMATRCTCAEHARLWAQIARNTHFAFGIETIMHHVIMFETHGEQVRWIVGEYTSRCTQEELFELFEWYMMCKKYNLPLAYCFIEYFVMYYKGSYEMGWTPSLKLRTHFAFVGVHFAFIGVHDGAAPRGNMFEVILGRQRMCCALHSSFLRYFDPLVLTQNKKLVVAAFSRLRPQIKQIYYAVRNDERLRDEFKQEFGDDYSLFAYFAVIALLVSAICCLCLK